MKDISSKFSLMDFLAYFFPGLIFLLSIFTILSTFQIVNDFSLNWMYGLITISVTFLLGIISSSLLSLFDLSKKWDDVSIALEQDELKKFLPDLKNSFKSYFDMQAEWHNNDYFMVKAAIREMSAHSADYAERQNSLRQFKRNSVIPTFFMGISGITWGLYKMNSTKDFLYVLFPIFIAIITYISISALKKGMKRNRKLEVREYCLSFILLTKNKNKVST